jgi:Flp pilus assembly protein TadG
MNNQSMRRLFTRRDERGSAVIETVICVPAFMLFVFLIMIGGRLAIAQQAVEAAASEAARTASMSRTQGGAHARAATGAQTSLDDQGLRCTSTEVDVDTAGFAASIGTPAKVTATVACVIDVSDLPLPGLRAYTLTSTMSSPIDSYRER